MLTKFKSGLESRLLNHFSWRTKRKIIVIESDDWGSIRMPSKTVYNQLMQRGVRVDQDHYCRYDALESEEDLYELFHVLNSFEDKNNRPAVFTANCLMANPDFNKIRESDFQNYYYQTVAETFHGYPQHTSSLSLWKKGRDAGLFKPQFHGREHVNVARWMQGLNQNLQETKIAFDFGTFGIGRLASNENRQSYQQALAAETQTSALQVHQIVEEGLDMFERLFGFRSASFIAPCYHWSTELEKTLGKNGVRYIQGNRYQFETRMLPEHRKLRKVHYTGKVNKTGQTYLVRNCHFEPSSSPSRDWVGDCMQHIARSFKDNKPAIISSHRVNYIGYIDKNNRSRNLKKLQQLLEAVTRKWPEVEFLSSDELGQAIENKPL